MHYTDNLIHESNPQNYIHGLKSLLLTLKIVTTGIVRWRLASPGHLWI